ncbi:MAG TPA: FAD-binding oxidoreductase [Kiritimatiellia bacterium]|nr:FAD-binding oxidoreductase [Kiritimatiellia bacterium]HSA18427.1 FAD-binding oxidoreductase [Kiritimatiellia bacterium]
MDDFSAALHEWREILGAEQVLDTPADRAAYEASVSGFRRFIPAILRPMDTAGVQRIVAVANARRIPLYPVSRGCNWGLGSRLPARDGAVIVDLARMNRIREVNERFHYAVVEPGVTQRQLYDHLRERGLPLQLNVTGSAADTSLIGNALERGIGYFSSKADSLAALEIVLGNGTLLRTGFGHLTAAKTPHLYRHGIGPALDGLFFQSNYGIVTGATVDLRPEPEAGMVLIARLGEEERLPAFVEALVDLRRDGMFSTVAHIGNRHRTRIAMAPLVHRELSGWMRGEDSELRTRAEQLLEEQGFGPWSAVVGIPGLPGQLCEARRRIRRRLRGLARLLFLTDRLVAWADRLSYRLRWIPWVRQQRALLKAAEPLYGLARGIPTDAPMLSVAWPLGKRAASERDNPDAGDCGLLYCVPFLPADGGLVREAMNLAEGVFSKHAFTPFITLNLVDDRAVECVINLAFDRTSTERTAAAHACNDELTAEFIRRGFPPYRVGSQSMDLILDEADPFWQTARDLKCALDPNGIIAPGRYNLR